MANTVTFTINFDGNAETYTNNIIKATGQIKGNLSNLDTVFGRLKANLMVFNQASQLFRDFGQTLRETSEPGLKLNTSMHDLSAITGITGKKLQEIEKNARQTAKTFGGSAAASAESYKLILSQLSPEIAKVPEALSAMGTSIATLSKTMGGDVAGATEVLTTAMNQFQVSTQDPIAAAKEMSRMMNVMAAAAQAGSAELPQIKEALSQSGMAAKAAGISFEEANAAIQVLDKAGKKGAEGGVALRNVMATLAQGRFLPKDVLEELSASGINISLLTDKTKSFADRLSALNPIASDTAIITKLFGKENSNAALALMAGTDQMREWTSAVTDTKSAEEQAAIVMQSKEEQLIRIKAKIDDFKIALFNVTGNLLPFAEGLSQMLVPISQMIPLISALNSGMRKLFSTTLVKGVYSVIKGLGAYALSLVTTGAAQTAFAATATAGFATLKAGAIAACRGIGIAIKSIPVFGWIIAILSAIGGAVAWAWNKFEGFRKAIFGVWEVVKDFGKNIWNGFTGIIRDLIRGISKLGEALWKLLKGDFKGAWESAKDGAKSLFRSSPLVAGIKLVITESNTFKTAYKKGTSGVINKDGQKNILQQQLRIPSMDTFNNSIVNTEHISETGKALASLQAKLDGIALKNKICGTTIDNIDQQIETVLNTISALTEQGYKEQSKEIQYLIVKLEALKIARRNELIQEQQQLTLTKLLSDQINRFPRKTIVNIDVIRNEKSNDNFNKISGAYNDLNDSFKDSGNEFLTYGDHIKYVQSMIENLRRTMQRLVDTGVSPQGAAISKLHSQIKQYKNRLYQLNIIQEQLGISTDHMSEKQIRTYSIIASGKKIISDVANEVGGAAQQWINYASNVITSIAQSIPAITMLISKNGIMTTSNIATAATGAAASVSQTPWVGPILAIAAAASVIGALAAIPKCANGGIADKATLALVGEYPGASNNPEVIAPLDKLRRYIQPQGNNDYGNITFTIQGRTLVGILKKEIRHNKRSL